MMVTLNEYLQERKRKEILNEEFYLLLEFNAKDKLF